MRLIDADEFFENFPELAIEPYINAPTVELLMGRMTNGVIIPIKRPQGEWKITGAYPHKVYCDKCFKTYAQANWEVWKDGSLPKNFCPNCGARMKGGAE